MGFRFPFETAAYTVHIHICICICVYAAISNNYTVYVLDDARFKYKLMGVMVYF